MAGRYLIANRCCGTRVGSLSETEYSRRLPGGGDEVTAVCQKPRYSKSRKKQMAQRPMVKKFVAINKIASAIFGDPKLKDEWAVRHQQARREGSRHNKYVPYRLWDYVRHEISVELKAVENANKK